MNDLIARCVSALEEVDIDATKTEDIVRIVIGAMPERGGKVRARAEMIARNALFFNSSEDLADAIEAFGRDQVLATLTGNSGGT